MAVSVKTNIYLRRHGKDGVSWMVRWKDPSTGRWKSRTGGRTRDEAVIIETQVRSALILGKEPFVDELKAARVKVKDVIASFYRSSSYLGVSEHWQATMRSRIDSMIQPKLGQKEIATLSQSDIYDFYFGLKHTEGFSNNTIRQYHRLLGLIGDVFVAENPGQPNVFRNLGDFTKRFKKQASTRDINFLTEEELELLFVAAAKARSKRLLPFAKFQAGTGLRRSETLRLKWKDIDWAPHLQNG